jgi:phospholipase/lecithinase/hemolysin
LIGNLAVQSGRSFPDTLFSLTVILALTAAPAAAAFTDLVVFGDSLSDIGNIANATFGSQPGPFYYNDRVSNGPVYSELLATQLGLGPLSRSTAGGNNFAYGGAQTTGTGGIEGFFIRDVDEQVVTYVAQRTADADTLYVLFAGANDLVNGQTDMSIPIGSIVTDIEDLIDHGARHFLVPNLPRLGTVPRFNGDSLQAVAMNNASDDFNAALATALDVLETSQPDTMFIRFDVAALFDNIQADPTSFGFSNVTDPAAPGLGVGDSSYDTSQIVANPDTYLFWDDFHPTTVAHEVLAELLAQAVLVAIATPGDGNLDGKVDGLDYLIWAEHFGDSPADDPPGPPKNGDFNHDILVNGLDYLVWASNFGQGPNDTLSVPEPSAWTLWLISATLVTSAPTRRRREGRRARA